MRAILGLALVVACGACSGTPERKSPPSEFSVDPAFSVEQATVIRDAVGAWCDAVAWCPTEVARAAQGHFAIHLDYENLPCPEGSNACNYDGSVWFRPDSLPLRNMTAMWLAAAHEAGHYGVAGHPVERPHLMAEVVGTGSTEMVVDTESAAAWCSAGCD